MTGEPRDDIRDRVQHHLSEAMAQEGMVANWVAVVEVMEANGDVSLWCASAAGMKQWTSLGMLRYAVAVEEGTITADQMGQS